MAIQTINIGTSANKGDGDPLRVAFDKINKNFAELNVTNTKRDINGSVFADDSTLLVDAVNGTITAAVLVGTLPALNGSNLTNLTIPAQTFASLTSKPTTLAGYGITDGLQLGTSATTALAGNTALFSGAYADLTGKPTLFSGAYADLTGKPTLFSGAFADLTSKPTTIVGYGITDATPTASPAFTGAVDFTGATSVDFTGATISGTSFLTSFTETDPVVGAITGIVKADGSGNISAAVAGTDYLTTVAFADLTGKPTTIAGYGITDALVTGDTAGTAAVYNLNLDQIADRNGNALVTTHEFRFDDIGAGGGINTPITFQDQDNVFTGPNQAPIVYMRGDGQIFSRVSLGNVDDNVGRILLYAKINGDVNPKLVVDIQGTTVAIDGDLTITGAITGYVSLATLKTEVAASADFAAFKTRIAAL